MDMQSLDRRYRQVKRATVARSVLDVIALIFLGCAFCFWGVAFWQLLTPPQLASLLSIQAVVLALVYSLATPLLWSALVPSTPAGQLLQKTQWRTFGFAAIVAAAGYLSYQAEWMIETWLYSQPGVAEGGMARSLALSLSIAFILIPALAWTQLTPERWLQQIEQAHQVKRLEMQQRGELAIIKAALVRAEILAAIGYANLLPAERDELYGTLRGMLMGASDSMRSIVKTLGLSADLERSIMCDDEIADRLDYVKQAIDVVPEIASRAQIDAPTPPTSAHVDSRLQPSESREGLSDSVRHDPAMSDSVARRIVSELPRIFTAQNLADLVQQDKRTAQRTIATWIDEGMIEQVQLGRYALKRGT